MFDAEDGNFNDGVERYPTVIATLDAIDTFCVIYFTIEYFVR